MDSYWNDWISPTKIHQTLVNVTAPYLLEKLSHAMQCSFVLPSTGETEELHLKTINRPVITQKNTDFPCIDGLALDFTKPAWSDADHRFMFYIRMK